MQLRRSLLIVFVFVVLVVENSKGQLFEGDECMLPNGVHGLCKLSNNCPGIVNQIATGALPTICSFMSTTPIVCCTTTQNSRPSNAESSQTRPTATTSTTEVTRLPSTTPLIGTACRLKNRAQGECKRVQGCPRVRNMILRGNAGNVRVCGFDRTTPIICCPINNSTLSAAHQSRPDPPSNNNQGRTRPPILRTTSAPPVASSVGSKSASMCEYFSQFVYIMLQDATLNLIPTYHNESQCFSRDFKPSQEPLRDVEQALYMEFPHLAALGYGNETNIRWMCAGSVITERFILTTVHCIRSRNYGKVRWVKTGDLTPTLHTGDTRVPYEVSEWIPHEDYRESSPTEHDIALIKLDRDVDLSPNGGTTRPACLYTQPGIPPKHKFAMAVGWGRTDWDDTTTTVRPMKKDLTFVEEDSCTWTNQVSSESNYSMICVADPHPEESSCVGDIGGPLQIVMEAPYCMQAIVGLTSFGHRACANATSHAAYTRVSDYISWIEDHVWP